MTGGWRPRGCAGVYVKGHAALRLAPPAPENSGGGAQDGSLGKLYTRSAMSTIKEGMSVAGYNRAMDVETRARGRLFERPEAAAAVPDNAARPEPSGQSRAVAAGIRRTARRARWRKRTKCIAFAACALGARICGASARSDREARLLYKGSFPLIYGLTRPGAWLLRKHGYDVRRRLLYETDKQRRAGWRFIEHRVDITEFMVRLELACRARNDVALIERKEIVDNAPKTHRDRRVRLMAKVRIDGAHQAIGRSRTSCSGCALAPQAMNAISCSNAIAEKCRCIGARARSKRTSLRRC